MSRVVNLCSLQTLQLHTCAQTISGRPTPNDDAERQFRNGSVRGLYKNYIESKAQMNSKEKQNTNCLTSRYLTEDFFEHITSKRSTKKQKQIKNAILQCFKAEERSGKSI